ncbi:MAG: phosphatase PAP2 family protein [Bacillota bacterium]
MGQTLEVESDSLGRSLRRVLPVIIVWLVAIGLSSLLDRPVATWVRTSGLDAAVRKQWFTPIIKTGGTYWLTLALAAGVWIGHPLKWQAAGWMALSGLTGLMNAIGKWGVGRTRPFKLPAEIPQPAPFMLKPFRDGLVGLFYQSNLAFPSGHACTAFATAAALAMLLPGWRWGFYAVAVLVAVERVAENAHYVSDVVAGAALGILGVRLIAWICDKQMKKSRVQVTTVSAATPAD